jgi:hypothetical protein
LRSAAALFDPDDNHLAAVPRILLLASDGIVDDLDGAVNLKVFSVQSAGYSWSFQFAWS